MIIRNIKKMICITFVKIGTHYVTKGGYRNTMIALDWIERAIPFMDKEECEITKNTFENIVRSLNEQS